MAATSRAFTLLDCSEYQVEIERSRFIARATPLPDVSQAAELIEQLAEPDARHNCFAWRCGARFRFHAADEPAGTTGKPILAAMEGRNLDAALVVVVRYFGGIKLDKGGLIRAYGHAAAEVHKLATVISLVISRELWVHLGYAVEDVIRRRLLSCEAKVLATDYKAFGLALRVRMAADRIAPFELALRDGLRGEARVELIEVPAHDW